MKYFEGIFKERPIVDINNKIYFIDSYPTMFTKENNEDIDNPITLEEYQKFLELLLRDKCVGSDGWTLEIFLHFLHIMRTYLQLMVEE